MPPKKTPTRKKEPPKQPREVVRVIDSREIVLAWAAAERGGHVEVREHRNGTWTIHYPEAAWIGCFPDCAKRHSHDTTRPMTQVNCEFSSPEEAYEVARDYAGTREIKVVTLEKPRGWTGTALLERDFLGRMVKCDSCEREFDLATEGATFIVEPYDKRRTKLNTEGFLCTECADELRGTPK